MCNVQSSACFSIENERNVIFPHQFALLAFLKIILFSDKLSILTFFHFIFSPSSCSFSIHFVKQKKKFRFIRKQESH
jgi:hypothetical protein